MIEVGSSLPPPPQSLWENDVGNGVTFPATGKFILVGVPGAFTPPCSSHVPGYVQKFDEFSAKGAVGVYIVSVNDIFVVNAWKKEIGAGSQVHFLSDSTGAFVESLGLEFDASGLLGNTRSRRFSAVITDGKVEMLNVEDDPPNITVTAAEKILERL